MIFDFINSYRINSALTVLRAHPVPYKKKCYTFPYEFKLNFIKILIFIKKL